jgi:hypothetical protein
MKVTYCIGSSKKALLDWDGIHGFFGFYSKKTRPQNWY